MTPESSVSSQVTSQPAANEEPVPKDLEQVWELHRDAQQAFRRQLGIAAIAIALLTATFFRSVSLIEESAILQAKQAAIQGTQASIDERFFVSLNNVGSVLIGTVDFNLDISQEHVVTQARACLLALSAEIAAARSQPNSAGGTPVTSSNADDCTLNSIPFLDRLSTADRAALLDPENAEAAVANRALNQLIVEPLNQYLRYRNPSTTNVFGVPDELYSLPSIVRSQRDDLREIGAAGEISSHLTQSLSDLDMAIDELNALEFSLDGELTSAIESSHWPSQVDNTAVITETLLNPFTAQMKQARVWLSEGDDTHASLSDSLADLETYMGAARDLRAGDTNSQYAKVQERIDAIRKDYAEPLPGAVALEPSDAARFFPVILSVLLGYFVVRYLQLKHRADLLLRTLHERDVTDAQIALYLPGLGRTVRGRRSASDWAETIFEVAMNGIVVLPMLLAVLTGLAVIRTPAMSDQAHWLWPLYAGAVLVSVGAFLLLAREKLIELGVYPVPSLATLRKRDLGRQFSKLRPTTQRGWIALSTRTIALLTIGTFAAYGIYMMIAAVTQRFDPSRDPNSKITSVEVSAQGKDVPWFPDFFRPRPLEDANRPFDLSQDAREVTVGFHTAGLTNQKLKIRWSVQNRAGVLYSSDDLPFDVRMSLPPIHHIVSGQSGPYEDESESILIPSPRDSGDYTLQVDIVSAGTVYASTAVPFPIIEDDATPVPGTPVAPAT